jgi:hypothetical protein
MRYCLIFFLLSLRLAVVFGQQDAPVAGKASAHKNDSLQLAAGLEKILEDDTAPASSLFLNIAAGNNLYNLSNNYLNASQNQGPLVAYNPTLTYYHKSGFNLSLGSTLLRQAPGGFGRTQYSLAAAYDWEKTEKFAAGLALTKYFVKDYYSPYASPIQNDAYAYFRYEKPFIEPGMTLGYSTGTYKTARRLDTVINGVPRRFYDSVSNRLKTFTASLTAEHTFKFEKMRTASDDAEFTPSLMMNMSSSSTNVTRKSNFPFFNSPAGKRRLNRLISNDFRIESLGLDLDLTYTLGNLVIEPDLYTDYYLQQTTDSRWSFLFTLNVGYIF